MSCTFARFHSNIGQRSVITIRIHHNIAHSLSTNERVVPMPQTHIGQFACRKLLRLRKIVLPFAIINLNHALLEQAVHLCAHEGSAVHSSRTVEGPIVNRRVTYADPTRMKKLKISRIHIREKSARFYDFKTNIDTHLAQLIG